MTINEIITKHYTEFRNMVRNPDITIEGGNTSEDIFQNVMVTTLKKFKGEVEESEGYEYIKKTLLTEFHFSFKRKTRDKLIFTDSNLDSIQN